MYFKVLPALTHLNDDDDKNVDNIPVDTLVIECDYASKIILIGTKNTASERPKWVSMICFILSIFKIMIYLLEFQEVNDYEIQSSNLPLFPYTKYFEVNVFKFN